MSKIVELADEVATVALGERIGKGMGAGGVVFLLGTLGAGKTTMTRGMLRGRGHLGAVKSPTYTLVEPYDLAGGRVYHFDLYRLGEPEELEFMGIRDYFSEQNLCIVEWPARGQGYLPEPDLLVSLSVAAPGRKAAIAAETEQGLRLLNDL